MSKKLPQPRKTLKSFILEEDAKVTDKTMTKISVITSFSALSLLANVDDSNAKVHGNHTNSTDHMNNLNAVHPIDGRYHPGNNPTDNSSGGIPAKTVKTEHANHFNHTNKSGSYGGSWGFGGTPDGSSASNSGGLSQSVIEWVREANKKQ